MKKFLSGLLISGLISMMCGVALAQETQPAPSKTEHKAKTADKAKTSDAKTKSSWDWGNKAGKAKTEQPKMQKTDRERSDGGGARDMNKTDKAGDKAKANTKQKR